MPQDFSGQNLQGRSFSGQDLTGANFSHANIRGADFSRAILRGANFSHVKAGLRAPLLILIVVVSLLIAAGFLTYTASSTRTLLAARQIRVNEDAIKYMAIAVGSLSSVLGAVGGRIAIRRITTRNNLVRRFRRVFALRGTEEFLTAFGFGAVLVALALTALSVKDVTNIFWGPWIRKPGGPAGAAMYFSPWSEIFMGISAALLGILAGAGAKATVRSTVPKRKAMIGATCLGTVAGVLTTAKTFYISTFQTLFVFYIMRNIPLSFLNWIDSSFSRIVGYIYNTIFDALIGAVAITVGETAFLLPVTTFIMAFVSGSVVNNYDELNYAIIYWIATPIAFICSFTIALATEQTSFQGADLTGANFNRATLKSTDFTEAKLDNVDLRGVKF